MTDKRSVRERLEQFKPFLEAGMLGGEIAKEVGLSPSAVSKVLCKAREKGLLGHKELIHVFHTTYIGRIGVPLKSQPLEVQKWIRDQIPEGGTVAEFAVACMVDAYYEDQT